MKTKKKIARDESRAEYDFDYSKAVRGKYYKRLLEKGRTSLSLNRMWPKFLLIHPQLTRPCDHFLI